MGSILSRVVVVGIGLVMFAACDSDGDGPDDDIGGSSGKGGKAGNAGKGGSSAKGGGAGTSGKGGNGGTAGKGGTAGQGGTVAQGGTAGHGGTSGEGGSAGGGERCPTDYDAADGTPCSEEGKRCASGNDDPCGFGQFLTCTDGVWVHQEAFPDPNCGAGGEAGHSGAGQAGGGAAGETNGGAGAGGA